MSDSKNQVSESMSHDGMQSKKDAKEICFQIALAFLKDTFVATLFSL